jgi:hypothetical protein
VIGYQPALKGLVPRGVNTIQVFALPEGTAAKGAKGKAK